MPFTNDNTNGHFSDDLLEEMNEALERLMDGSDNPSHEKNLSDQIMDVAKEGMSADDIIAALE